MRSMIVMDVESLDDMPFEVAEKVSEAYKDEIFEREDTIEMAMIRDEKEVEDEANGEGIFPFFWKGRVKRSIEMVVSPTGLF